MGGQIAAKDSLHIDMRGLNHILQFSPQEKIIRVQSGVRWHDIQSVIDAHGLAIMIMQTYSDFTVGGAVSVNCHGRYIGLGPLVLSIRSLQVMLHNGELLETSSTIRPEIFYGVVGGYGALGIITEVELDLAENTRVERTRKKLDIKDYLSFFREHIRNNPNAVFHNADLYPPHYQTASAVTWSNIDAPVTTKDRLNPKRLLYLAEKYFMWAITETPFGKWRREHIIDPIIYARKKVHWRNYEAGYNVQELEPLFRDKRTYVLQEYFIPVDHFLEFTQQLTEVLQRHHVNIVNISVRHAHPDSGCYLAWAREEMFAFVLYYKQRTRFNAKQRVAVWTRELVNAALNLKGSYYLPYQPHATASQFHTAYKNAEKLFAMKRQLDPNYRFRNSLWDKYYTLSEHMEQTTHTAKSSIQESEFHAVYQDTEQRDNFYRFLQNIYHIYPEDRFHTLIMQACARFNNDQSIYAYIQNNLASIKPAFSDLTYALPALRKQKQIIAAQTTKLLGNYKNINGYLEIGSTGRYVNSLKKIAAIQGDIYLTNDNPPSFLPSEVMERGQLPYIGQYFDMKSYAPISESSIPSSSVDVVTCYIGLHHCPPERLAEYVASIHRIMTNNGLFILRDHDAGTQPRQTFVSLVHTVFNAGLNVDWDINQSEERQFNGIQYWASYLTMHGFEDIGARILQDNDPTLNTLMAYRKIA